MHVVGWYNKENIGDDAFKDAFVEATRLNGSSQSFEFVEKAKLVPGNEKIVLGGGDVVRPYYLDQIADNRPVWLLGVGLGYESEADLLEKKNIQFVLARNKVDTEIFRNAGIRSSYCPDITFVLPDAEPVSLEGRKAAAILLSDEISPTFERRSDFANYSYLEYFKWELAGVLDELAEYYDLHFVPFSTLSSIDDRKINLDIYRRMERRDGASLVEKFASVREARSFISSCALVVSMKYHGIMFAVQAEVPFISIALTRKASIFCMENGLESFEVPPFSLQKARFKDLLKEAESDGAKSKLVEAKTSLCRQARNVFPETIKLLMSSL